MDLEKLEAAALAAGKQPWDWDDIRTFNPEVALAPIAEIKRLRSLNADYVCIIKQQKATS